MKRRTPSPLDESNGSLGASTSETSRGLFSLHGVLPPKPSQPISIKGARGGVSTLRISRARSDSYIPRAPLIRPRPEHVDMLPPLSLPPPSTIQEHASSPSSSVVAPMSLRDADRCSFLQYAVSCPSAISDTWRPRSSSGTASNSSSSSEATDFVAGHGSLTALSILVSKVGELGLNEQSTHKHFSLGTLKVIGDHMEDGDHGVDTDSEGSHDHGQRLHAHGGFPLCGGISSPVRSHMVGGGLGLGRVAGLQREPLCGVSGDAVGPFELDDLVEVEAL